ncbi:MAG: hypothetical protein ACRC5M_07335 [Anaeroplasmataceae bacterium]
MVGLKDIEIQFYKFKRKVTIILKNNLESEYINNNGRPKAKQYLYSERIKASEKLRIDINLEEDPFKMLDAALLCIYCLTGDKSFYNQNRKKVIDYICNHNNYDNTSK